MRSKRKKQGVQNQGTDNMPPSHEDKTSEGKKKQRRRSTTFEDEKKKKKKKSGELLNSSSSSDSEQENSQDVVDVDFEFFDPKPEDYHGVKALLRLYLDERQWDLGGFVDIILSQTTVGTVIKIAEDESPIGVTTALNLGRYKDRSCMRSLHQFLCSKCTSKKEAAELENIFEKHPSDVGLLISERLINIPEELAPPLYRGLFDEISWATEDEPSHALRESFKFKYYLILTRVFHQLRKRKASKASMKDRAMAIPVELETQENLIYTRIEDEMFHELSFWACKFPINSEALASHEVQGLKQFRLVMLLKAEAIEVFKTRFCSS